MLPPLIMKCVAKLCRRVWVACPAGRSDFTSYSTCRNNVQSAFGNRKPRFTLVSIWHTFADTGTVRGLFVLVLTNVTRLWMMCSAFSFDASPHLAPVLRQRTAILMNAVEVVITKILDVLPRRNYWITRVEILGEGGYSNADLITYSERDARSIHPGDTVFV